MKIVAAVMVVAGVAAVVQTVNAPRAGKRLALRSVRSALEERAATDRDGLVRDALAARDRLRTSQDLDTVFRDVTTVWLAREPSADLSRPTITEFKALPANEALDAVRRLTPDTGFEGARIRSLYEARNKTPREQQPVLARMVAGSPTDYAAVRAYIAALWRGLPEERRKAIELAREYVQADGNSAAARLTLLLAIRATLERETNAPLRTEAVRLASDLKREVSPDSFAAESIAGINAELAIPRRARS